MNPHSKLEELPAPFVNDTGVIQNILEQQCGSVAIISSKAGSSRSHHYHKTDEHWLYVLVGSMWYFAREHGDTRPAKLCAIVGPGQMIHTGPMVEHVTHFPADTVMVSMSKLTRTHGIHEDDVVRCKIEVET